MNNMIKSKFMSEVPRTFFSGVVDNLFGAGLTGFAHHHMRDVGSKYELHIPLPGMCRKDISVQADENALYITTERPTEKQRGQNSGLSVARFSRSFVLPKDADVGHITARCENGLLSIEVGKQRKSVNHRTIKVKGPAKDSHSPGPSLSATIKNGFAKLFGKW
jgi:HSP20 family molecular chaperone IbpA